MDNMKVLISPMNWGFGHAGRMIAMALELKKRGSRVIFAAAPDLLPMLKKELPDISLTAVSDLHIRYSRHFPQYWYIFLQIPAIIVSAFREHSALKQLVNKLKPDIIISDNKPGFWHKEVFSVYVTHQLRLRLPPFFTFLEPVAAWLHRILINHYDLCLVPDLPGGENLSGRLSHGLRLPDNTMYMGPLSRFSQTVPPVHEPALKSPYYCIITSGPEPQRSLLFEKIASSLQGCRLAVMSGSPLKLIAATAPDITFIINPDTKTMKHVISGSDLVITRAGYTSIMELVSLGKGAILIPTPGQTEQEYFGIHLNGRYGFITLKQNRIKDITRAIERRRQTRAMQLPYDRKLFDDAMDFLFEQAEKRRSHSSGSC